MPEWSKGSDSSSDVVRRVGSNPTPYNIMNFHNIVNFFTIYINGKMSKRNSVY